MQRNVGLLTMATQNITAVNKIVFAIVPYFANLTNDGSWINQQIILFQPIPEFALNVKHMPIQSNLNDLIHHSVIVDQLKLLNY